MKIAVLSPIAWRTPPRHYGPWEQVASNIAEGLVKRGHDVTLFATGDSMTQGALQSICDQGYEEDKYLDPKVCECLHISSLMEQSDSFDIIHNNFDFLPLTYSRLVDTPMVTTLHGFSSKKIIPVYQKYNDHNDYVSISYSDRSPKLKYSANVYNGINIDDFDFRKNHGDYLLYFGRIHPDKGTYEAIKIAHAYGMRLMIAGIVQDEVYYKEKVLPFIDEDRVVFLGHAGPKNRDELLGNAYALLHPISFEEPFGLSVAESMLTGTPVVAFNKGSMPELIKDGETGFLVKTVSEAVDVLDEVKHLDRQQARDWAASEFSAEKMVDEYIKVYETILNRSIL